MPLTLKIMVGMIILAAGLPGWAQAKPPARVNILIAEQCTGETAAGVSSCEWRYANGAVTQQLTTRYGDGNFTRSVSELNAQGNERRRTDIRHRQESSDGQKTSEFIEIFTYLDGRLAAREETRYQFRDSGSGITEMEWTQYEVDPVFGDTTVSYHVRLVYDQEGRPFNGLAGKWRKGVKTDAFLDWNRRRDGTGKFQINDWRKWESWLRNISLHATFA